VDFQIPVHKVGDNLLNTVTDWHSYCLDNQNQIFTCRMRLRITQDRKKLRVSMDRVRFDGTKPAELFSFLRRFVRACNNSNVWEGQALYLVGSFLTGAAATRFNKILPDTAGHIPGPKCCILPGGGALAPGQLRGLYHTEPSRVGREPRLPGRP